MIACQLKQRLDELGWNIKTTSKRTGIHYQMISKILRGETRDPRASTLVKLSDGLGISVDQLIGNEHVKRVEK